MTTDSLFKQLQHPNPHLRERAMWELAESRDEQTIPRLMGILAEENMTYRRAAVKALGAIGADAVPTLVESLLHNDNPTIRASCTKALAQVSFNHPNEPFPAEGVRGLKMALDDPNPVVHIAAVMALGQIGRPVLDILIEALKTTENPALAVALVNALGSLGDRRAAEVLATFAENESIDAYVRESAASALSRSELVSGYQAASDRRSS